MKPAADLFGDSAPDLEAIFWQEVQAGRPACVNRLRARFNLPRDDALAGRIAAKARTRGLVPAGTCHAKVKQSRSRLCQVWRAAPEGGSL